MQVFNVYFKIIKKNIPLLSIYLVVFLGVAIAMTQSNTYESVSDFTETQIRTVLINDDIGSIFAENLSTFIKERSKIMDIENNKEALQDAFFFREAEYVVRIPAGFTENIMSGKSADLEVMSDPISASGMYMDMLINSYMNTAKMYLESTNGLTETELVEFIEADLVKEVQVEFNAFDNGSAEINTMSYFFNFAAYSTFLILILGITTFMLVFEKIDLKRRNICSPLSEGSMNVQTLSANFVLVLIVCAIVFALAITLYGRNVFTTNGLLWMINLVIMALVAMGLSVLIGNLIKGKTSQAAVANTLVLGMSFLTGVFVPQYLLGSAVISVGKFLPTYWYVRASNIIGSHAVFSGSAMMDILYCYLIQLGFAAAFVSITLVLVKQKRTSNA